MGPLSSFIKTFHPSCVWDSPIWSTWWHGAICGTSSDILNLTCQLPNGHCSVFSQHFSPPGWILLFFHCPTRLPASAYPSNFSCLLSIFALLWSDSGLLLLPPTWNLQQIMGFSKEHQFLSELGLGPRNPGCYVAGVWRASGPVVSSTNPANNQVRVFCSSQTDRR